MVEKQKAEIVAAKRQRDGGQISLSSQKDENDSNRYDTNLDQEDNLNPAFL